MATEDPTDAALLRRVERVALGIGAVGALSALLVSGYTAALVLTLGGAASIFGLRSLRGLIGRLTPSGRGGVDPGLAALLLLRAVTLGGLLILVLAVSSTLILPLLLGLSVVPAALICEGITQLLRPAAGDHRHG